MIPHPRSKGVQHVNLLLQMSFPQKVPIFRPFGFDGSCKISWLFPFKTVLLSVSLEVSRCFVENKDGTFSIQTPSLSDHPDEQYNKEGINKPLQFCSVTDPDPEPLSQVGSGIIVLKLDPKQAFLSRKSVFSWEYFKKAIKLPITLCILKIWQVFSWPGLKGRTNCKIDPD
jgi:hypothetical protein